MSPLARVLAISPFGPIFSKELRVTSRRKRSYMLRVIYLGMLLLGLLLAYASTTGRSYGGLAQQSMRQAALGQAFFVAFTIVCVGSMGLIAPVLTAQSIGSERLAKTLPVLLMTPINAWQVVSGKLFSRVLAALTLLGLSLPVLALVRLLGGVELSQMYIVLAVAVAFLLSSAAIGMFYSLLLNRAAVVILLSYATLGILYVLVPIVLITLLRLDRGGPRGAMDGMRIVTAMNPLMSAGAQTAPPMIRNVLGGMWVACVIGQLALAGILVTWTSLLLRRQFRTMGESDAGPAPTEVPPWPQPGMMPGMMPGMAGMPAPVIPPQPGYLEPLPPAAPPGTAPPVVAGFAPPAMGAAPPQAIGYASAGPHMPAFPPPARPARDVSDQPVLWREVRRPMLPKLWQRIVAVTVTLSILALIYLVIGEENDLDDPEIHIGFSVVFFGLWWLVSAVFAATAIAQEKESDTWTLLLASPLSGAQIVWGKAAGLLRRMLWPTVVIVGHFFIFMLAGMVPIWAFLFVIVMTLACNSLWVATGIWLSLRIRRVTTAVVFNLLLAIVVYGLVPLAVLIPVELIARRHGKVAAHALWHNPYFFLGSGFDGVDREWQRRRDVYQYRYNGPGSYSPYSSYYYSAPYELPSGRAQLPEFLTAAMLCAIGHLLAAWLIMRWTTANFDEIVGRAGRRRFAGTFETDEAVLPLPAAAGGGAAPAFSPSSLPSAASASSAFASPPLHVPNTVAPPTAPAVVTTANDETYAGIGRRAVAWLFDTFLIQVACALGGLVWGIIAMVTEMDDDATDTFIQDFMLDRVVWASAAGLLVGWLYHAGFEASARRATPGKTLMAVFVADEEGKRISFARASARYFAKLLSALPLGAGFIMAGFGPRKQALHDKLSGTVALCR